MISGEAREEVGSMGLPIYKVDAFTHVPFRGNPAGVCPLEEEAAEGWMQAVAAEMNVSETAFLVQKGDHYVVRYFTPTVEVPLCGHATLSSAHVLWEGGDVAPKRTIVFQAEGGRLTARRDGEWIQLDFPALPVDGVEEPEGLARALGVEPVRVHRRESGELLVELETEEVVRAACPDIPALHRSGFGHVIITARSSGGLCDFVSRFFAPGSGIPEDPVTGVAHCSLAPYWAGRLGRDDLVGHQVSQRGGVVRVRARGDRVELLGQAVTILRGELLC
jgi:PhzF family phenazine biosynthesis protein